MNAKIIRKLYRLVKNEKNLKKLKLELYEHCHDIDFDEMIINNQYSKDILLMLSFIRKTYESLLLDDIKDIVKNEKDIIVKFWELENLFTNQGNEIIRFDTMLNLFKNPSEMLNDYNYVVNQINSKSLEYVMPSENNFKKYYAEFQKNFDGEIHKFVQDAYKDDLAWQEKNKFAVYIITEYLNSSDSFKIMDFYIKYNLNDDIFNKLKELVKTNNPNLYRKFISQYKKNQELFFNYNIEIIKDLNYAIQNGLFIYGNTFDVIEFIKYVPFKESKNFYNQIKVFIEKNKLENEDNILEFIKSNHLDEPDAFKIYDYNFIINQCDSANNNAISYIDAKTILDYLTRRDVPLYKSAINYACEVFLSNNLAKDIFSKNTNVKVRKNNSSSDIY